MNLLQILVDTTKEVTPTYSILKDILGTEIWQPFVTQMFMALIGVSISLLLHAQTRDKYSPATPVKFSIGFLIVDNWKRVVLSLLLIYVFIRFFPEIFGINLSLFWCLAIGLSLDKLAQWLKDKISVLQVKR